VATAWEGRHEEAAVGLGVPWDSPTSRSSAWLEHLAAGVQSDSDADPRRLA